MRVLDRIYITVRAVLPSACGVHSAAAAAIAVFVAIAAGVPCFALEPVDSTGTVWQWDSVPGALHYDIVRGNLGELFDDGASINLGSVVCVENDSADTTTAAGAEPAVPDILLPASGEVFFYLVRSSDGVTDGRLGSGTSGNERAVNYGGCLNEGEPPPAIGIVRPGQAGVEDVLGLRLAMASTDWSNDGTTMVGPVELETSAVDGGTLSVRYADGAELSDSSGPIIDRAIPDDGSDPTTILLTNVRFPSQDEDLGTLLEVEIRNPRGVTATATVALNVDANPPTAPSEFQVDQAPYLGQGGERSGESDLSWFAGTDDSSGGGSVARYELRAMCQIRSSCDYVDWAPIDDWESKTLLADLTSGLTAYHLESIGFDEDWVVGIRAFDEADNWSPVTQVILSTRLDRTTIGTHPGLTASTPVGMVSLGDVNDDGRDDVAVSSYGSVTLMLGETDPVLPAIPGNPFDVPPPGDPVYFGSDLSAAGDVNGDGLSDFVIGSFGFGGAGDNCVYLYFGTSNLEELMQPDVIIQGPPDGTITGAGYSRTGYGNFMDLGSSAPFDDLIVSVWDIVGGGSANLYVVLGRATAQWPSVLTIAAGPTQVLDNCADDIITVLGENPPPDLPVVDFGLMTGLTTLNDDDWTDIIASTSYPGGLESSAQYVFRGAAHTTCPTGYDLSTADEILVSPTGGTTLFRPSLAVLPTVLNSGGGVVARGLEYAVGLPGVDTVEVYRLESVSGSTVIYQAISSTAAADEGFGSSLAYVGNIDEDASGGIDLAIGAPSSDFDSGQVYLALSAETDPRLPSVAGLSLDLSGATAAFGTFVVGGFDYNGDGYSDLAVADIQNETIHLFY